MASRDSSIKALQADASSRSLGASALNVSLQASWVLSLNLLLDAFSGLGRERSDTAAPGTHPMLRCITHSVPWHLCRRYAKVSVMWTQARNDD